MDARMNCVLEGIRDRIKGGALPAEPAPSYEAVEKRIEAVSQRLSPPEAEPTPLAQPKTVQECFDEFLEGLVGSVQAVRECDRDTAVGDLSSLVETLHKEGVLPALPGLEDEPAMSVWMAQASLAGLGKLVEAREE